MTALIIGSVENGRGVTIETAVYSGPAGVRVRDGVTEVAYLGSAPRMLPPTITIDGEPYRVTGRLASAVVGMTLLLAVPA